jgi:hypothetical protein
MASRYLADVSGQLNASGAGFATSEHMLIWTKAIVTAQAPNSPNAAWTVGIGMNTGAIYHQLAFGIGANISCGPYTLAPGEALVVSITGGGASDTIRASLFGLQDVDPNAVGMDTAVGSSSSVLISGGNVTATISGTVPVAITGTPTVNISGTVPVSISGTPTVNIGGTTAVSITANSVNFPVFNATGTKITSARPPTQLGIVAGGAGSTTDGYYQMPADAQGLVIQYIVATSIDHVTIRPSSDNIGSVLGDPLVTRYAFPNPFEAIPLLPSGYYVAGSGSNLTWLQVRIVNKPAQAGAVVVSVLSESSPLFLEYFAPPFAAPNQPLLFVPLTLANNVAQWIIPAVANVQINLFDVILNYFNPGGAGINWIIGFNPTLPANGTSPINSQLLLNSFSAGPFTFPLNGAPLPRGSGLYAVQLPGVPQNFAATLAYSLS